MADQISKKEIEELRHLIRVLGKDINDLDFDALIKSASGARELLQSLRKETKELSSDVSYASVGFRKIVEEISHINKGNKEAVRSFNALASIADRVQYHQKEISKLTLKDVENLKKQTEQERERLIIASKLLEDKVKNLSVDAEIYKKESDLNQEEIKRLSSKKRKNEEEKLYLEEAILKREKINKELSKTNLELSKSKAAQDNISDILKDQDLLFQRLNLSLNRINSSLKEENKLLGLGEATIGGISGVLNKLGLGKLSEVLGIDEAQSKMKTLAEQIVKDKENETLLQEEIYNNEKELNNTKTQLINKEAELLAIKEKIANLKESGASNREINKNVKIEESLQNQVGLLTNKKKGLSETLASQSSNLNVLKNSNAQFAGMNGQMSVLKTGVSSLGSSLSKNLTSPLAIAGFLIMQLVEAIKLSDKAAGDLAKDFNITYDGALNLREELTEIASLSGDVAVTTRGLQESMVAIGKTLGSNAMLNAKDLVFMTQLREKAGFVNEELVAMERLTLATGGNLEKNTQDILYAAKITGLNNGVLLNEKEIYRDIAKASDAVKLSVAGGAKALGEAAAQAKALGMNLNQLDNIAGGLLDFESSITAELEAQLLTGKNINLEQARLYAINNDYAGLAREIAKNIGSAAEFSKMNRLQQEALARAVGMTREELARTLTDQEALRGLSGKQAEDAKAALAGARARGMTEEEIAKQGIKNLMHQQSVQDRFNQSVEKLKEIFVAIAGPVLEIVSPLADLLTDILPPIVGILKPTLGMLAAIAHTIAGIIKFLTFDLTGASAAFSKIPRDIERGITGSTQFKMAEAITGTEYQPIYSQPTEVQDAIIDNTGLIVGKYEKGKFKQIAKGDPKDNAVLTTNSVSELKPKTQNIINESNTNTDVFPSMSVSPTINVSPIVDIQPITKTLNNTIENNKTNKNESFETITKTLNSTIETIVNTLNSTIENNKTNKNESLKTLNNNTIDSKTNSIIETFANNTSSTSIRSSELEKITPVFSPIQTEPQMNVVNSSRFIPQENINIENAIKRLEESFNKAINGIINRPIELKSTMNLDGEKIAVGTAKYATSTGTTTTQFSYSI